MGINQPGIEKRGLWYDKCFIFCEEYSESPVLHHHVDLTEKL
jgi:hypothetical protein